MNDAKKKFQKQKKKCAGKFIIVFLRGIFVLGVPDQKC